MRQPASSPPNVDDLLSAPSLRQLLEDARCANHRLTILLSGDALWTRNGARRLLAALPELSPVWLGDEASAPDVLALRAAFGLLGCDLDLLVYDAHGGFDPDAFGAATGAIQGGGLLVLLTPPLATWPALPDPQAERIAVWPHAPESLSGHFLARLVRVLEQDPNLLRIEQDAAGILPIRVASETGGEKRPSMSDNTARTRPTERPVSSEPVPRDSSDPGSVSTPDQRRAVELILKTAHGRARRPLVLSAHRGRGKSAALGLAAGRLLLEGGRRILVTAPARASVDTLYRHAQGVLTQAMHAVNESPPLLDELAFRSPAELVEMRPPADLLLIDEAAGIPAPLLDAMLAQYGRIVFATTVHGYEGTGRGFDIRFRATLDRTTPDWRALTLEQPIRWASDDPLESLTFRALLLDAAPAPDSASAVVEPAQCACERIEQSALAQDETTLHELFGLLVLAHYQTRPMDLRMLLDGTNVRILALRHQGHLVATLLAAEEGSIGDSELREAIYLGRRRPRGHLLPQTLSAHAGLFQATAHRYVRVIRIAVHPAARGRGLGRMLLTALGQDARADGFDLVGASFGATPELLAFWGACGHVPVQIGASRNAVSGEHAVVVLAASSRVGARFLDSAQQRLQSRLTILLAGPLRALDPALAVALIAQLPDGSDEDANDIGDKDDLRELDAFTEGHRSLEATLPLLAKLCRRHLGTRLRSGAMPTHEAALLVAAGYQLRSTNELARLFGSSGRTEILQRLRVAARGLRPGHDIHSCAHQDAL